MATTDHDALVRLLGEHYAVGVIVDDNDDRWAARCTCTVALDGGAWPIPSRHNDGLTRIHRAHLADVIEAHYAERVTEARESVLREFANNRYDARPPRALTTYDVWLDLHHEANRIAEAGDPDA